MISSSVGIALLVLVSVLTGIGHVCFKLVAIQDLSLWEKIFRPRFIAGTICFLCGPVLAILAARVVSFFAPLFDDGLELRLHSPVF